MSTPAARTLEYLWKKFDIKSEGDLARKTCITQATIHRIKSGESANPSTRSLQKLAAYFKVNIEDFVKGAKPDIDENVVRETKAAYRNNLLLDQIQTKLKQCNDKQLKQVLQFVNLLDTKSD